MAEWTGYISVRRGVPVGAITEIGISERYECTAPTGDDAKREIERMWQADGSKVTVHPGLEQEAGDSYDVIVNARIPGSTAAE